MPNKIQSLGQAAWMLSLFAAASLFADSPPPLPPPQPAEQLFKERPFGPLPETTQAPPPKKIEAEDEEPIPREWIIGGVTVAVLILAGILYGSARAWHSSNIFDQQYRFSVNQTPALRFGGPRCGGHMATIGPDVSSGQKGGRR